MQRTTTRKKKRTNASRSGADARRAYVTRLSVSTLVVGFGAGVFFGVPLIFPISYTAPPAAVSVPDEHQTQEKPDEHTIPVTHVEKPESVRAIYMTACVAGTPSFRQDLVELIEETELNSIVIDIKDYTGGISFPTNDPQLAPAEGVNCYAPDMQAFINTLHARDIYVIGRITVFQDPFLAPRKLDIAVRITSATGSPVWRDYKGLAYIDPGARYAWEYTAALAKASYNIGFDEINFDYIRFPSDGDMSEIYFPVSESRVLADPKRGKARVLRDFWAYLHEALPEGLVTSADLFGMTTTNTDDLNIGQILEYAAPHFDYIAPMVYPSHYPPTFNGWANPNDYPYEVVHYSMARGATRLAAFAAATTTPTTTRERVSATQLRPWLQDFDYGGDYDAADVRAQIQATYDAGLNSWMLWAPSNRYTKDALLPSSE